MFNKLLIKHLVIIYQLYDMYEYVEINLFWVTKLLAVFENIHFAKLMYSIAVMNTVQTFWS